MNTPLIAAWVSAVIGLVAMRLLMGGNQVVAECAFGVQVGFVAALFFASTVLFERGSRQSPNSVRRISAWVMCAFLLLTSVFFAGFLMALPTRSKITSPQAMTQPFSGMSASAGIASTCRA